MNKIGIKHLLGYMLTMSVFTILASKLLIAVNFDLSGTNIIYAYIAQAISDILAFYLYTKYILKESFKEVFGINSKSIFRYLILSLALYLSVTLLNIIISYLVDMLSVHINHKESLLKLYNMDVFNLACSALIIAPLREELLFRGILQPMLVNKTNAYIGIILTALIFTGCHTTYLATPYVYINLFILAVIMGVLRYKTKSIIPGYLLHFLNNLLGVLSVA